MIITLSKEERDKFASWLEQESSSDEAMYEQMQTLPGTELVAKKFRQRAAMFAIIAEELRKIEDDIT